MVAEIQDKVVGTGTLYTGHYSTWTDSWYGHIEDLYVDEDYRRQGVARRLIEEILAQADSRGLTRVELHTLESNKAAQNLYEEIGFTSTSILYDYSFAKKCKGE